MYSFCLASILRCIHVVAYINSSFIFIVKLYLIIWIYHNLFIHLSVDRYLGCFHFVAIMNNVTMNSLESFLCGHLFSIFMRFLGFMVSLYLSY